MKTILLQLSTLLISTCLFSQSVGINTDGSAPTAGYVLDVKGQTLIQNSLDVSGNISLSDNQLRLRGNSDGNHWLSYHGGGGFDGAKLYGLNTVALQTSNMEVVLKDSRVGINTASPSKGRLHVASSMNDYINGGTYFSAGFGGLSGFGTGNHEISIYGERHILAGWGLLTESDARIKNIIGISDGTLDLETLSKVEVTDYTMIDDKQSGSSSFKKVIAQQVESVYPMAVSNTVGFIPDVYRLLNMENGAIKVKSDLEVGDRVKIFTNENKEVVATVKSKTTNKLIFDFQYSGKAFIYGKEVKDFKVVDYEALAMLNVSATQELYRIIQAQKEQIEALQKENGSLKASVENNEQEIEKIKNILNLVGQK